MLIANSALDPRPTLPVCAIAVSADQAARRVVNIINEAARPHRDADERAAALPVREPATRVGRGRHLQLEQPNMPSASTRTARTDR
jgi:hypothetical protein